MVNLELLNLVISLDLVILKVHSNLKYSLILCDGYPVATEFVENAVAILCLFQIMSLTLYQGCELS